MKFRLLHEQLAEQDCSVGHAQGEHNRRGRMHVVAGEAEAAVP